MIDYIEKEKKFIFTVDLNGCSPREKYLTEQFIEIARSYQKKKEEEDFWWIDPRNNPNHKEKDVQKDEMDSDWSSCLLDKSKNFEKEVNEDALPFS